MEEDFLWQFAPSPAIHAGSSPAASSSASSSSNKLEREFLPYLREKSSSIPKSPRPSSDSTNSKGWSVGYNSSVSTGGFSPFHGGFSPFLAGSHSPSYSGFNLFFDSPYSNDQDFSNIDVENEEQISTTPAVTTQHGFFSINPNDVTVNLHVLNETDVAQQTQPEEDASEQTQPTSLSEEDTFTAAFEKDRNDETAKVFDKWWNFCREHITDRSEDGSYRHSIRDILVKNVSTLSSWKRERAQEWAPKEIKRQVAETASKFKDPAAAAEIQEHRTNVPLIPQTEALVYATFALFDVVRAHPNTFILEKAFTPQFVFYVLGFVMNRQNFETSNRFSIPANYIGLEADFFWGGDFYNYYYLQQTIVQITKKYLPTADNTVEQDVTRILYVLGFGFMGTVNPLIMRVLLSYGKLYPKFRPAEPLSEFEISQDYVAYNGKLKKTETFQFDAYTIKKAHSDLVRSVKAEIFRPFSAILIEKRNVLEEDTEVVIFSATAPVLNTSGRSMVKTSVFDFQGKSNNNFKHQETKLVIDDWASAAVPIVSANSIQVSRPAPRFFLPKDSHVTDARDRWELFKMLSETNHGDVKMPATYCYFFLSSGTIFAVRPLSMIMAQNVLISSKNAASVNDGDYHPSFQANVFSKTEITISEQTFVTSSIMPASRHIRSFFSRSSYGTTPNAHYVASYGFTVPPGESAKAFNNTLLYPFSISHRRLRDVRVEISPYNEFMSAVQRLKNLRRLVMELFPRFPEYKGRNDQNIFDRKLPIAEVSEKTGGAYPELVQRPIFFRMVDFYMQLGDALFMDNKARTYWANFFVPHTITLCWPASLQASYYYLVESLLSPTVFGPFFYEPNVIPSRRAYKFNELINDMYASNKSSMWRATQVPSTWKRVALMFSKYIADGKEVPFMDEFKVLSCNKYQHQLFFQRAENLWKNGTAFKRENAMFATIVEPEINETTFNKINSASQTPHKYANLNYLKRPYGQWTTYMARTIARGDSTEQPDELEDIEGETPRMREKRLWKKREDDVNPAEFPLFEIPAFLLLAERALAMLAPDWCSNFGRNESRAKPDNIPSFFSALFQYACLTEEEYDNYSFGPIHDKNGVGVWHPTVAFDQSIANIEMMLENSTSHETTKCGMVFYATLAAPWVLVDGNTKRTYGRTTFSRDADTLAGILPGRNLYNTANFIHARSNGVREYPMGPNNRGNINAHEFFEVSVDHRPAMMTGSLRRNINVSYPKYPCSSKSLGVGFKLLINFRDKEYKRESKKMPRAVLTDGEKESLTRDLFPVPIVAREGRGINRLPSLAKNDIDDFVRLFREGDSPAPALHNPTPTVLTAILSSIRSDPERIKLYRAQTTLIPKELAATILTNPQFFEENDEKDNNESEGEKGEEGNENENNKDGDGEESTPSTSRGKKREAPYELRSEEDDDDLYEFGALTASNDDE